MNLLKKFSILATIAISSLAIAQSASARFVIFVAGNDSATLQRVRTIAPTAFATRVNDQPAIQAGTFNSEISADSLAIALQQSGLSAQKYFKASGGKESNVPVPFADTSATALVTPLSTPQQVVIQQAPNQQLVSFPESQLQVLNTVPQQSIAYTNNQYQQIATNAVVPQVQTQQVLVSRWQQVLVPETRQVITQTVIPQTQIVQTGYTQSGYVQPTAYVQQSAGSVQSTAYVQPQTGFIQSSSATVIPNTYDNSISTASNYSTVISQPISTGLSNEQLLPQPTQNTNFRYVAAVPSSTNNQFLLLRVRQYVPNAFLSNSGRGTFIHAGAYQNRDSAESVSRYLRSQGVDSRVLYF